MLDDGFTGFEPRVGEVCGVRTFRIGEGGVLLPLFSDVPWHSGTNIAACQVARPPEAEAAHTSPDPECSCGFYVYATADAADDYPHAQHVLAVVACWGHVVAGTRGLRCERARVDAIWMSPVVPQALAQQVAQQYSGTALYSDREEMLIHHPPTALDCYQSSPADAFTRGWLHIRGAAVAFGAVLGLVPASWITGNPGVFLLWLLTGLYFAAGVVTVSRRPLDPRSRRQLVACLALLLWLIAPLAGAVGIVLLRIPLIQLIATALAQRRQLARQAATFPAVIM